MDLCTVISAACWFECVHSRLYRQNVQTSRLLQVLCTNPSAIKSHVERMTVLLHTGDEKKLNSCFVQLTGHWGPKHLGVDVL